MYCFHNNTITTFIKVVMTSWKYIFQFYLQFSNENKPAIGKIKFHLIFSIGNQILATNQLDSSNSMSFNKKYYFHFWFIFIWFFYELEFFMNLFLNWNFLLICVFFGFVLLDFGNGDGLKSINICWSHKVSVWIR